MSKNINEIPYTELQERVIELGRIPENAKSKVRGIIQDVYTREIPSKFDWKFLFQTSGLTTIAEYKVGTVSVNTGDTALTFSSDVTLTSSMTERKIKISGNDTVYNLAFTDATGGTINPTFEGINNANNNTYSIFQPFYSLAASFDRFPKDGGVYRWEGGKKRVLPNEAFQEYVEDYQSSPSTPEKMRLIDYDTAGCQRIELRPAPNQKRNYGYDFIQQPDPLKETSEGTITISALSQVVTGNATAFTNATTGDWLRVDDFGVSQDSTWYRVISISHDSSLKLHTAFANSSVTSANYVISSAPKFPNRLHPAVLFGSLRAITLDQTDESFQAFNVKMAEVLSDAKRIHVSRTYSQEFKTIASEEFLYRR